MSASKTSNRWGILAAITLVLAAIGAAYSNSLHGEFVFDDVGRIWDDQTIRSAWPPWPVFGVTNRPFAHYTMALNYAAHGYEVFGFHLVNLAIHALAALTVFGIIRRSWSWLQPQPERAGQGLTLGFMVALIWGVHPLNTQAVSYIVQRYESLMALAYLLTLYSFIRAQQSARISWLWYGLSLLCCAFGMGCKEVMVTAPVLVLWYDRAIVAHSWREIVQRRWFYYLLLASTWGVLAWAMLQFSGDYEHGSLINVEGLTPFTYLTNQSAVLLHYLRLSFWPTGQCAYYHWPVEYSLLKLLPYLAITGSLFVLSLWLSVRRPALGLVAMSFFIVLAPTSSIVPIVDLSFEHRMYLPLVAVVILACLAWMKVWGMLEERASASMQRRIGWLCVVVAAAALGMATFERNKIYASGRAFWEDTHSKAMHHYGSWLGMGTKYAEDKEFDKAEEYFQQAMSMAPNNARVKAVYAGLLISRHDYEKAAELLNLATDLDPSNKDVILNKGILLSHSGQYEEAQEYLEAGIRISPRDEELQTDLIANLCYLRRFDDALATAEANLKARPNSAKATNDVAACWLAQGNAEVAELYCLKAIELEPELPRAHATLAMSLADRDPAAAIGHMETACRLEPGSDEFWKALGNLQMQQDPVKAIEAYQQVLKIRAVDVEVMLRLSMAYDSTGQPEKSIPLLEKALEIKPDLAPVQAYLHSLRQRLGQ